MKTLFSNKHRVLLIRGGISLVVLYTMVSIFITTPLGTHAQKSATRPQLGTTKTAFSDFCYASWTSGLHSQGLGCLKQSRKALQFLQQLMPSAATFAEWPQQDSLSALVTQNLLINPQTKAPIKTQQDFLAAIPSTNRDLQALFRGHQGNQLLSALWIYQLTSNNAPPPPPPPVSASDQPPGCPGNSQSFQNSDVWPTIGPILLTNAASQLQDQNSQHLGVYDIYGRLLLQNQCSMATLGLKMKALNGNTSVTASSVSQWERDVLTAVPSDPSLAKNPSLPNIVQALTCLTAQTDNTLIDTWFSGAVITHPITTITPSTAPPTSGSSPTSAPSTPDQVN